MSTKQIVILVVVLVVVVFGTIIGALALLVGVTVPRARDAQNRTMCQNNLRQIEALLTMRLAEKGLKKRPGPAYILQIANDVDDEDLDVFVCPGDQDAPDPMSTAYIDAIRGGSSQAARACSYRGPDRATLEALHKPARTRRPPVIIACCAQGDDGRTPCHEDGISVLYASGKVEFIPYENMTGYTGDPVRVGPDSPDPRFRHLVR